jgi:hypothetical protein
MKKLLTIGATLGAFWLAPRSAGAQEALVTLLLDSGEEIQCRVIEVWQGDLIFEAKAADDVYRYGDRISVDKVSGVKLSDGRVLRIKEFVDYLEGRQLPQVPTPVRSEAPPSLGKSEAEIGMKLTPRVLKGVSEKSDTLSASRIGLHLFDYPPPSGQQNVLALNEIAELLAELGLAGRVLQETSRGSLANRALSESQQRLLEALKGSPIWQRRKIDLRDAHQKSMAAFMTEFVQRPEMLRSEFGFEVRNPQTAFIEFVQFVYTTAVVNVDSEWQKVKELFGAQGAAALFDVLNNYDDWYFLYGAQLESR